jgi:5-methyltetrahydrofolate--homocysteine methyltransferase
MPPTMGDRAKAAEDNFIGCYPKPGLPKPMDPGVFNEAPEPASRRLGEMTPNSLLNLVDGGRYTRPGCARTS